MCLILKHTSLAQYGMSHLAKGMVVPVIGSLVVAFSLLCMAKEFTCLLVNVGIALIAVAIVI